MAEPGRTFVLARLRTPSRSKDSQAEGSCVQPEFHAWSNNPEAWKSCFSLADSLGTRIDPPPILWQPGETGHGGLRRRWWQYSVGVLAGEERLHNLGREAPEPVEQVGVYSNIVMGCWSPPQDLSRAYTPHSGLA